MKKNLILLSLFISCISYAQSNLPSCNGDLSGPCFGVSDYTNGQYVGEYKDGKRNGQGTYTYSNGEKYIGHYKDGKRNGQGTYIFPDGSRYLGQWKDSEKNGQGTFIFANGNKYVGQFKDGKSNGQGTFTFTDGAKYVGQFRDGNYNGFGTFYNANGSIRQQGLWRDDEFIQVQAPPSVTSPVVPKPPVYNAQEIKRQKCIRLGLA